MSYMSNIVLFKIISSHRLCLSLFFCVSLSISHEYSINILAGGVWRILEHKRWALWDIDFALAAKNHGSTGIDT